MSARSFKIFIGVFFAHLVVLNVIWVGFSAPVPRPPATFTYQGALPAQGVSGTAEDAWSKGKTSDQFAFDHPEADHSDHWIEIRGPSKPVTHL
jgi:hypothetical protein